MVEKKRSVFRPLPLAYEDRIVHRYVMHIMDINGTQSFLVRLDSNPTLDTYPIDVSLGFNVRTLTRQEWQPLTIKIIDTINNSSVDYFSDWMHQGFNYDQIGVVALARDYKRTIKLEKIDPVGGIVAEWELHGAFIQELNHEIVWDNTTVGQVEMRIVFDHALLIH